MEATVRHRPRRAARPLDGGTIGQLFERHGDNVFRFCLRVLGNEHDAADALQTTFLNLARRRSAIDGDDVAVRSYLFAAARNACFDLRRRDRGEASLDALHEQGVPETPAPAADRPEQRLLDGEARALVLAALRQLPERQRTAWALREFGGLSYEEIGERLGMNPNAVAQLLHRARGALHRALSA